MSQPPAETMASDQPLVGTTIVGQPLEKTTIIVRLINLVVMVWSMLESQENPKNCLSPKNGLNQEKNRQK